MNKPILLLQFRPSPTAEHEVECFRKGLGLNELELDARNVILPKTKLPPKKELKKYSGFIFGASSDFNATDWPKNIKIACLSTKYIYDYVVEYDMPTLGICFGHQLLAIFGGGKVERNDEQSEAGVVEVFLNGYSDKAVVFDNFPKSFYISSGHKDSVVKLPKGAKHLAYSQKTKYSAYQIKNNIFSIQQHPELTVDGLVWRLSLFPEYLKGKTIEEVKKGFKPMPYATKFLENFKKLLD